VVLILTPRARLAERAIRPIVQVHRNWQAPNRFRVIAAVAVLAFFIAVPSFAGIRLIAYTNLLTTAIVILSLGLLVKLSRQVSLCQLTFAAIGATTVGHLVGSYHVPWLLAVAISMIVVIPVAALVAIPAIRLSGVFLALATLGFAVVVQQAFFPLGILFGSGQEGIAAPRPGGGIGPWSFGSDEGFYFVVLVFTVLAAILIELISKGRLGRLLTALGDSPRVLETHGTTVGLTRLIVFCVAAALAALSGALTASLFNFAVSTQFDSFTSLTLFVTVLIIIAGSPWYAILAAAGITLIPSYLQTGNVSSYLQLVFGLGAVTFVFVARKPPEVPASWRRFMESRAHRGGSSTTSRAGVVAEPVKHRGALPVPAAGDKTLSVSGLRVRFGGVVAVRDLDLQAPLGKITGLIGPNGAGKSTTFNACSGLVRADHGSVAFLGRDITSKSVPQRARFGIGRTFQRAELLDSRTVVENVAMGTEARLAGASAARQVYTARRERAQVQSLADEMIQLTGLEDYRGVQVGILPTGIRRLVEVARVLAGGFSFLLMDEPSSGLDAVETRHLGEVLRRVVRERGIGILLVEHDMNLVRQICEYVYVLDFGSKIFEGAASEMQESEAVRAAYLGSDYAVIADAAEN
jgi:ABC-type branched-subunit amino acid transport system ATPase component/ABC-type branched-subunit amino acid transport system permease subunit